jgi:hypothetical protein
VDCNRGQKAPAEAISQSIVIKETIHLCVDIDRFSKFNFLFICSFVRTTFGALLRHKFAIIAR